MNKAALEIIKANGEKETIYLSDKALTVEQMWEIMDKISDLVEEVRHPWNSVYKAKGRKLALYVYDPMYIPNDPTTFENLLTVTLGYSNRHKVTNRPIIIETRAYRMDTLFKYGFESLATIANTIALYQFIYEKLMTPFKETFERECLTRGTIDVMKDRINAHAGIYTIYNQEDDARLEYSSSCNYPTMTMKIDGTLNTRKTGPKEKDSWVWGYNMTSFKGGLRYEQ